MPAPVERDNATLGVYVKVRMSPYNDWAQTNSRWFIMIRSRHNKTRDLSMIVNGESVKELVLLDVQPQAGKVQEMH